jgi:N6-adenosine-specific RNA methylase IME4
MKNLAHSASFESLDKDAPSKAGTKHLGRRGRPERLAKDVFEIILAPRREHSRKPDEVYRRIERYCAGPRLELFARESRPGWTAWGNETTRFDAPDEAPAIAWPEAAE